MVKVRERPTAHGGVVDRESRSVSYRTDSKLLRRTTFIAATLLVSLQSTFFSPAFAQAAADKRAGAASALVHTKPEVIPPFEPDIFWAKVLSLLGAQDDFIRRQSVNEEFSSRLETMRSDSDGGYFATDSTAAIFVAIGLQSIALAQVESAASPQHVDSGSGHAVRVADPAARHDWQSFLKLAAKPNAIVTVNDLENAFGRKTDDQGDYHRIQGVLITLMVNSDRFARAVYPNRPTNFVSFDFTGSAIAETCIRRDQVISNLLAAGWLLHAHSSGESPQGDIREVPPSDSPFGSHILLKGDQGVIHLGYSEKSNCATTLTMESDKLTFDRLSGIK